MKTKSIEFITLFFLFLVTGLFWGTWFALSQSIDTFSAAEFIHIGKTIIQNVALPMKIIMPSTILLLLISVVLYPTKKSNGFYLSILALALMITSLLITVLIEVPLDNQIKLWTASEVPSDWEDIRSRWQFFHSFRTITSLASFASYSASIIFRKTA